MTPDPHTVYRGKDGLPMFYVRTEQRPGAKEPEHLFACAYNRAIFQRWELDIPAELELVVDTEGRKQANELRVLLEVAEYNNGVLVEILRLASQWLPAERHRQLRQMYAERAMREDG